MYNFSQEKYVNQIHNLSNNSLLLNQLKHSLYSTNTGNIANNNDLVNYLPHNRATPVNSRVLTTKESLDTCTEQLRSHIDILLLRNRNMQRSFDLQQSVKHIDHMLTNKLISTGPYQQYKKSIIESHELACNADELSESNRHIIGSLKLGSGQKRFTKKSNLDPITDEFDDTIFYQDRISVFKNPRSQEQCRLLMEDACTKSREKTSSSIEHMNALLRNIPS